MGVDLNGAFATEMVLPYHEVSKLPSDLSPLIGAYVEPLASTLAILTGSLSPEQRILVLGNDRISQLSEKILRDAGFTDLATLSSTEKGQFDAIVEACSEPEEIIAALPLLKPNGLLLLKSRTPETLSLPILDLLKKRLRIECVYFGSFHEALELTLRNQDWITTLIGESFPLEEFSQAFQHAQSHPDKKTFFRLS